MRPERQSGFTLIELLVTISVVAILLAWGLPSFQQSLRTNRIAASTNEMIASLALARSEAIRNARGSGVCASADGATCGTEWGSGWLVWADANGNGSLDSGETVLRYSQGRPQVSATGAAGTITFDSRGRRRAAADQTLSLRPTDCGGQPMLRTLTVNAAGQVRTAKGACS
ncbi:pre-pilin like leader sequence [Pseudoxanthomonas broegbernensis]|uniref:Type II secretion system protein H n=1 Tax=Pseudoxanthomonas broegbernensis TaxID=83619 RepID=A0A7V8GM19_9GAMM|nr:Tfp pilus assembly protein FimT/FimU [Pseudoxanthomonas broegbernensis]KAF1686196.1 pre-pilin like leader sequence [Pseudoxanthomonas broegbernensis]MBB6063862.1 type IV fimbrial biogenesis protein FimT [Pseudoxanthomonas broegbernensis]